MIKITVNGKEMQFEENLSITDLIQQLHLEPQWAIVELNGEALLREDYYEKQIQPNDKIEIVRPVAGG